MSYKNGPKSKRPVPKPTRKYGPPPPLPPPLGMTSGENNVGRSILDAYGTLGQRLALTPLAPFQGMELPPLDVNLSPRNPVPKPIGTPEQLPYLNAPRGLTTLQAGANRVADTLGDVPPMTSPLFDGPPAPPNLPTRTYNYRDMPGGPTLAPAPVRDMRKDAQGGLWSLLAGAVAGGLLGEGQGALTGAGSAGQGFLQGADAAEQQRQQQYQLSQQNALQNAQLQRQGIGDFNAGIDRQREMDENADQNALKNYGLQYGAYKDRQGEDIRRDELARREQADIVSGRSKFFDQVKQLTPPGQQDYANTIGPDELKRLGIGFQTLPDGRIQIAPVPREAPLLNPLVADNIRSQMDARERGQILDFIKGEEKKLVAGLDANSRAAIIGNINRYRDLLGYPALPPDYQPPAMTPYQRESLDDRKTAREDANGLKRDALQLRQDIFNHRKTIEAGGNVTPDQAMKAMAQIDYQKTLIRNRIAALTQMRKDKDGNAYPVTADAVAAVQEGERAIEALDRYQDWLRVKANMPPAPGAPQPITGPGDLKRRDSYGDWKPMQPGPGVKPVTVTVDSPIGPISGTRPSPSPSPTPKPLAIPPAAPKHHSVTQPRNNVGQFNGPPKKTKQTQRSMSGNPKKQARPTSGKTANGISWSVVPEK
jgi:hypothetical protein